MNSSNVYLAFFDILGFKALRAEKGTKGLYDLYMSLKPMISHSAAGRGKKVEINGESLYVPFFSEFSVKYKIFSDSIIFYTEDDSLKSFFSIINSSFQLLQSGFCGIQIPLRGAISHSDLIDDHQIFIGEAVEDAFHYEELQVWSGCVLTEKGIDFVRSNDILTEYCEELTQASQRYTGREKEKLIKASRRIVEYDCPMQKKGREIEYYVEKKYVLDWTLNMYEGAAEKSFPQSECKHANMIRNNTIEFEKWARSRC